MLETIDAFGCTNVFCVYCRLQKEEQVKENIFQMLGEDEVTAYIPKKTIEERRSGKVYIVQKPMIGGYLFLYAKKDYIEIGAIKRLENVVRILSYGERDYKLRGADKEYAMWIYSNNGIIDISDVIAEGKEVKVISGPLLSCNGEVVKLDRRKKRALVLIDFDGIKREISLGVNVLIQS